MMWVGASSMHVRKRDFRRPEGIGALRPVRWRRVRRMLPDGLKAPQRGPDDEFAGFLFTDQSNQRLLPDDIFLKHHLILCNESW
jgi:hypothetical protein